MNTNALVARLGLGALTIALAVAVACGGGGDSKPGENVTRNLTDPRGVPSATLPPAVSPIAITDSGGGSRRGTQTPDVYVVKSGDTPAGIAAELGVDLAALLQVNGIEDARGLRIGQTLKVPRPTPTPTPARPGATPARPGATPARPGITATAGSPRPGAATPTGTAARGASPTAGSPTPTATAALPNTYTVVSGDTACAIATRLGVSLAGLAEANNSSLAEIGNLRIGQVLRVPTTRAPAGC